MHTSHQKLARIILPFYGWTKFIQKLTHSIYLGKNSYSKSGNDSQFYFSYDHCD